MKKTIVVAALMMTAAACWAQSQPAGKPQAQGQATGQTMGQPGDRPMPQGRQQVQGFMDEFFPPEIIMQNQQSLNLTDEQKKGIKEIMKKSISDFTDLQWQESSEREAMSSLMKQDKIDEAKAMAQFDKLINIENGIKRLHMSGMIKVKNLLTPEQIEKLRTLKKQMPSPMGEFRGQRQMNRMEGNRPRGEKGDNFPPPTE